MERLSFYDKVPFGKYKGQTMEYILQRDPGYIVWLFENVNTVSICHCLVREAKQDTEEKYDDFLDDDVMWNGQ